MPPKRASVGGAPIPAPDGLRTPPQPLSLIEARRSAEAAARPRRSPHASNHAEARTSHLWAGTDVATVPAATGAAGGESALQLEERRLNCVQQIMKGERRYILTLQGLIQEFYDPLLAAARNRQPRPLSPTTNLSAIFGRPSDADEDDSELTFILAPSYRV